MRDKTKNHKICSTCTYALRQCKECQCPNLSRNVFSYVQPTIENANALRYMLNGIDREALRNGEALKVIAFRAATYTGQCRMYNPVNSQRHEAD